VNFHFKQVNDPVHGSIFLSNLESDIISSKVFQRLHNIKQLGLGVSVYPGANYSRFSHSLGACHLAGKMYDAIWKNSERECSDDEKQLYRLGGLLHDVGHYPFSHTFEHAAKEYYASGFIEGESGGSGAFPDHEEMGELIIRNCPEIKAILKKHSIDAEKLIKVFRVKDPETLTAILSSDVDCDRLDYLMRTAHHAGLPYGNVDVNYIVNSVTTDCDNIVCLERKALKAADHMLMSRYFDYTQLPFHKTITSLEISLEKVIQHLLEKNIINCSKTEMIRKIKSGEWNNFDDQNLTSKIRGEYDDNMEPGLKIHYKAFLERKPAKLVFSKDAIADVSELKIFDKHYKFITKHLQKWANKFEIPISHWEVKKQKLKITKHSQAEISNGALEVSELVRIKGCDKENPEQSIPLIECKNALINKVSELQYVNLRIFVNFDSFPDSKRNEIQAFLVDNLSIVQN